MVHYKEDGMPKLTEVRVGSEYAESINTGIGGKDAWKTFKSEVSFTLEPETDKERGEWQDPAKIDAVSTWIHEQIKRSIHLRMLEDGCRTGNESDFVGDDEGEGDD